MPVHRHLKLHLFRLKHRQEWNPPHEGLLFLFPKAGAGTYHCDSSAQTGVQPLAGGDVLVHQAGTSGKVRAAAEADLAFVAFSVCLDQLYPIFLPDEVSLVQPLMDSFKTARFYPASSPAATGCHQLIRDIPSEFDLAHRSQLLRVAGAILSEEFKQARPPLSGHERTDTRVTSLFEELSVEQILNLSAEEMAERFGCSQRHLNRLFKRHFGLSVGSLRMEMRLLKVVSLLRNTDFKITLVAEQCGFHHLGLFNACFKRRFGISPGQWRKNLAPNGEPERALPKLEQSCRLHAVGLCPWLEPPREQKAEVGSQ